MAAGTWNQGRLEKRVEKIKLNEYPTIQFEDISLSSDQVFNVVEFPNRFTAGKNLIKIRASAKTLVKNSTIHIEVLDSDNLNSMYMLFDYLKSQFGFIMCISHIDAMRDIVDKLVEIKKVNGYSEIAYT